MHISESENSEYKINGNNKCISLIAENYTFWDAKKYWREYGHTKKETDLLNIGYIGTEKRKTFCCISYKDRWNTQIRLSPSLQRVLNQMAATGRAIRSNSKSTGMNTEDIWQPREKVSLFRLYAKRL